MTTSVAEVAQVILDVIDAELTDRAERAARPWVCGYCGERSATLALLVEHQAGDHDDPDPLGTI